MPRKVNDRNHTLVIVLRGMIEESNCVPFGRYPGMANPSCSLIKDVAQGIFQTPLLPRSVNNGERLAIRETSQPIRHSRRSGEATPR